MPDDIHSLAAAIADVFDYDPGLVDQVEGMLLVAAGSENLIKPVRVAHETDLGRAAAANLFRQLEDANAVQRDRYVDTVADSSYSIRSDQAREVFSLTRDAIRLIQADQQRHPPETEAVPLVTFPDDPSFTDVTPADFGMEQLLSALATEAKNATDEIVLLAPFFEGTGFERLRDILADALERGVQVTIITRYLADSNSHNRAVIEAFLEHLETNQGVSSNVSTYDYTVWSESVPASERRQDGAKPAFTLHAKMMLFDDSAAYIGSANVTDYGFDRYLELGVMLRGASVDRCRELYQFLLTSDAATSIEL